MVKAAKNEGSCMFNAVTDVVGINRFTETIFTRVAGAGGMANAEEKQEKAQKTIILCASAHRGC